MHTVLGRLGGGPPTPLTDQKIRFWQLAKRPRHPGLPRGDFQPCRGYVDPLASFRVGEVAGVRPTSGGLPRGEHLV